MVAVASSGFDMARQRRPTGPAFPVDNDWKRDIRAAMKKQGISQADLASKIGVTPSALTVLFRPATKQTRLKPAIHRELGLVPPDQQPAVEKDEALTRLMRAWAVLADEERALLVATANALKKR